MTSGPIPSPGTTAMRLCTAGINSGVGYRVSGLDHFVGVVQPYLPASSIFMSLAAFVLKIFFYARKALNNSVAHGLHTFSRDLVECVLGCVPIRIAIELNDVDRVD